MYCKYCGKKIPDDSEFCMFCGSSLTTSKEEVEEENIINKTIESKTVEVKETEIVEETIITNDEKIKEEQTIEPEIVIEETTQEDVQPFINETKNKNILPLIIIPVIVVGIVAVILFVFVFGNKSFDILSNSEFIARGYNGYGSGYIEFAGDNSFIKQIEEEINTLEEEYEEACYYTNSPSKCEKAADKYYLIEDLLDSFSTNYYYDQNQDGHHLKNGDKVEVEITYDEDLAKEAKFSFKNTTKTYVVTGLQDLQEKSIFNDIELKWQKSGNDFYLDINGIDSYYDCLNISDVDENGNVIITIDEYMLAENYGIKSKDGNNKTFNVGSKPEMITYINDENRYIIEQLALDMLHVYTDKCGYMLYPYNGEPELILTPELINIRSKNGVLYAKYKIPTDKGSTYTKEIEIDILKDSNGEYRNIREYDRNSFACAIKKGNWPEND